MKIVIEVTQVIKFQRTKRWSNGLIYAIVKIYPVLFIIRFKKSIVYEKTIGCGQLAEYILLAPYSLD
jgi:hypothetical protein